MNGFECFCSPGFTEERCTLNIDDCVGVVCQNGGTCNDEIDDFTCSCTPGYSGKLCDTPVDLCVSMCV